MNDRIPCNGAEKDAIAGVAAYISQRESHLDILVSDAGIKRDASIACSVLSASLSELQASMCVENKMSRPA